MARVALTVNGTTHTVEADGSMPLLWVLRDLMGLTGTKYGCGIGVCGSCTVLRDGVPVRSCQTPVRSADGGSFTTIEGLAGAADDAVVGAWMEEGVSQCGYCQPGMVLRARALLADNPNPTDGDVDVAFAGHVCRCGSYPRLRRAVHRAAATLRTPDTGGGA